MLRLMVLLAGFLLVVAATDDVQARRFRRSRGGCPNGQCYTGIPAVPGGAVTLAAGDAAPAAVEATPDEVAASEAPAVAAPEVEASTPAAEVSATVTPTYYRQAGRRALRVGSRVRLFRRR